MQPSTSPDMQVVPLSDECRAIWQRGEHALVGISAGNSYFNQDRITALLEWAGRSFARVDVVYVDTNIDAMLIADGRSPEYAAKSVKSTLKDVRRRIRRSLERLGPEAERFHVRALSELMDLPAYRAVRGRTDQALRDDRDFSAICEEMVRQVVLHRPGGDDSITAEHLRAGLDYVKAEAPLLADSPSIFGAPSSVVLYHLKMPMAEHLALRKGEFHAARDQGYVVVRPSSLGDVTG
ncbi:tRNA-dependent cyclodipeptide synthase [Streptomyces sp. NPDC002537]